MKNNSLDLLLDEILSHNDREKLLNFLEGILTPAELEELPNRLEIVKRLKKGQPQHMIAAELGVGVATVTRGSRELKQGRFKYVKA